MLTLFSKFRQFLKAQNSANNSPRKNPDKKSTLSSGDSLALDARTHPKSRLQGEGRRSNRDRMPKPPRYNAGDQCLNNLAEPESIAAEKAALENDIRRTVEGLPEPIKYSYLTLLDALLTHSDCNERIERVKALHVAALDASRHASGRSA